MVATGYRSACWLPASVATLRSTYAFAIRPLEDAPPWLLQTLIGETARPCLYAGATAECNLLVGGADDDEDDPQQRELKTSQKCDTLQGQALRLLPLESLEIQSCWSRTFGETEDCLPYLGRHSGCPGAWFALGYGGNGATFAMLARQFLSAELDGTPLPEAGLSGFGREGLARAG